MDNGAVWSKAEKKAWEPAERITVSVWADRYRRLSTKESSEAGRYKTKRTPYLQEIMDCMGDPGIDEIVIMKCSQAGGSEAARNALGYWIDQAPGPCLIVFPSKESAKEMLKERLLPLLRETKRLSRHIPSSPRALSVEVLRLTSMEVYLAWSGSPQSLATRPCRYVILDELDKYPAFSGKDADPSSLAEARTRTFKHRKKIIKISTPTVREGAISQAFDQCPDKRRYHVPCLHCGLVQPLIWAMVKYPSAEGTEDAVQHAERVSKGQLAWLQCRQCKARHYEHRRLKMVAAGEWVSATEKGSSRRVGFSFNALVNPWSNLSVLAAKWLRAKKNVARLMEFINQELGEPFEDQVKSVQTGLFSVKSQKKYTRGLIPSHLAVLVASVDTQKTHFFYVVRAFGRGYRSRLIDQGRAESFDDLKAKTLDLRYPIAGCEVNMRVTLLVIDSGGGTATVGGDGSRTDEVYRWSRTDPRIKPIKGYGGKKKPLRAITTSKVSYTPPGQVRRPYDVILHLIDTQYYKDLLAHRIHSEDSKMWEVNGEIDSDYIRQMTSEHKVVNKNRSTLTVRWKPISNGIPNHYWDCEVYAMAAADILQVGLLPNEEELKEQRANILAERKNQARVNRETNRGSTWVEGSNWWKR